jgi:ABC-2 type transport system permease protein
VFPFAVRTFSSLFLRPTAYAAMCLFAFVAGGLYWSAFFTPAGAELSLRAFFETAPLLLAFFAPVLTMDVLTGERRAGTLALLRTYPVSMDAIAWGAFLGVWGVWTVLLGLLLWFPICLAGLGPLELGPVLTGMVGLWLLGGAYLAIGIAASSRTADPVSAALVGFAVCFALTVAGDVAPALGPLEGIADSLSTGRRFRNAARGILDLRDLCAYLSWIVLALLVAAAGLRRGSGR